MICDTYSRKSWIEVPSFCFCMYVKTRTILPSRKCLQQSSSMVGFGNVDIVIVLGVPTRIHCSTVQTLYMCAPVRQNQCMADVTPGSHALADVLKTQQHLSPQNRYLKGKKGFYRSGVVCFGSLYPYI